VAWGTKVVRWRCGAPPRSDDEAEQAAVADDGVGAVDDPVPKGVEGTGGGAHGDRLAGADLAGEDAEAALLDKPGESGHRLLMGAGAVERGGRDVAAQGDGGEAEIGAEAVDAH
jgi:hypothetical protein